MADPVDIITPRLRELGGHTIRRLLPVREQRAVGPFVFMDEFGPMELLDDHGLNIPPHPHIGLATVTYLFSGSVVHRDSLGSSRIIGPGEVNLMTAGRGIVHSERTGGAGNAPGTMLSGIQTWLALPRSDEEVAPEFFHADGGELPVVEGEGWRARVILGGFTQRSPVPARGGALYVDCVLDAGSTMRLTRNEVEEVAAFAVEGVVRSGSVTVPAGALAVFRPDSEVDITADSAARLLWIGGDRLDGPRHMWWNFVSSSADRIRAATDDWRSRRFPAVPGDDGYVPAPAGP